MPKLAHMSRNLQIEEDVSVNIHAPHNYTHYIMYPAVLLRPQPLHSVCIYMIHRQFSCTRVGLNYCRNKLRRNHARASGLVLSLFNYTKSKFVREKSLSAKLSSETSQENHKDCAVYCESKGQILNLNCVLHN